MERQGEGRVDLLTSGQGQQKQQLGQHAVLPLPAREARAKRGYRCARFSTRFSTPYSIQHSVLRAHFQIHSRAEGRVAATALPSTWPAFLQKTYW